MRPPAAMPDPEQLLLETERLRGLARALVRDEHLGDDVIGETRLLALRRGPRPGWDIGAWLHGVARRIAGKTWRRENERPVRERAAAREEAEPDPASAIVRLELIQQALAAVHAQDEPYRRTLVLRFVEGLAPAAIAAREGIPVETVKTRLKRGLDRVRAALDREAPGGRAAWVLVLAPWSRPAGAALAGAGGVILGVLIAMKTAIVIAGGAVLIAALWWFWPVARIEDQSSGNRPSAPGIIGAPPAAATSKVAGTEAPMAASPFAQPSSLKRLGAGDGPWDLLIVAADTGDPLPGAVVHFLDPRAPLKPGMREPRWGIETPDPEKWLEQQGQRVTADAHGRVGLPPFENWLSVSARHGGRWAWEHFQAGTPLPIRLALPPDESLRIQTVDSGGSPRSGVPVAIRFRLPSGGMDLWKGVTAGPDAIFEARHLQIRRGNGRITPFCVATLASTFTDSECIPIDLDHPPAGVVRLHVPDSGRVVIDVTGMEDQPFTGMAFVGLGPDHGVPIENDRFEMILQWVEVRDGIAAFPCVGLGVRFSATLLALDHMTAPGRLVFEGPGNPGEEVRASLRPGPPYPCLTGRFVDGHGRPLAKRDVTCSPGPPPPQPIERDRQLLVRMAEDGTFKIPVIEREPGGEFSWLHFTTQVNGSSPYGRRPLIGACALPPEVRTAAETRLGDLTLSPAPTVVTGTVVDAGGRPVPGARIEMERFEPTATGEGSSWRDSGVWYAASRGDGSFEMFGPVPEGRHRLVAACAGYIPEAPVAVAEVPAAVTVVFRLESAIEGSALLPEGVAPTAIEVLVEGDAVPTAAREFEGMRTGELDSRGSFRVGSLGPGAASVKLLIRGDISVESQEEIARCEDIRVHEGAVTRDPRLQAWDLRERLRLIEVLAVDGSAAPVQDAIIRVLATTGDRAQMRQASTGSDGRARVVLGPTPAMLSIEKRGCRRVLAAPDRSPLTVALESAPPLAVSIAGVPEEDWNGVSLRVLVRRHVPGVPSRGLAAIDEVRIPKCGPVSLQTAGDGDYDIEVWMSRPGGGPDVLLLSERTHLGDDVETSILTFTVPPGRWTESMKGLGP